MNFLEAVKAMKQGKKVRSTSLNFNHTIHIDRTGAFITNKDVEFTLTSGRLLADWEIVEDKNPTKSCLNCDKKLEFKGFCSLKCHNEYYDNIPDETKNTLSDKIHNFIGAITTEEGDTGECLRVFDVKASLKELIDFGNGRLLSVYDLKDKAKEIFGEDLVGDK